MPGRSLQLWVVWLLARQLTGVCDCGLVRVENTECCLLECFSLPTGRHLWHVYSGQGTVRFCGFHPKIVGAMRPGPQFSPLVVLRERWLWCPLCHWSLPRQAGILCPHLVSSGGVAVLLQGPHPLTVCPLHSLAGQGPQ